MSEKTYKIVETKCLQTASPAQTLQRECEGEGWHVVHVATVAVQNAGLQFYVFLERREYA